MRKFDKHLKLAMKISVSLALLLTLVLLFLPRKSATTSNPLAQIFDFKPQPKTTTIFLAGDIMLSRNVADKMSKAHDYNLPFEKISDLTQSADIAFANLESPFNDQGQHFIPNSLVFNADPQSVAGLTAAGFDVLSTANNHAFDQGQKGITYTLDWLNQHHILPIGTGPSCHAGQILEHSGLKFGFLAYSFTAKNNGTHTTDPLVCDANDLGQINADVTALRPQVDFLIVSMHAGIEYTRNPNQFQQDVAHTAIDAGADFVVGAHPHWVQTPEQYQGKWIFYSLGNFIFDQMWSQDTREGLTLKLSLTDAKLTKIDLVPVIIDDYCCARPANPDESAAILRKVGLTSNNLLDHN